MQVFNIIPVLLCNWRTNRVSDTSSSTSSFSRNRDKADSNEDNVNGLIRLLLLRFVNCDYKHCRDVYLKTDSANIRKLVMQISVNHPFS